MANKSSIDGPLDEMANAESRVCHHLCALLDIIRPRWNRPLGKAGRYEREKHGPGRYVLKRPFDPREVREQVQLPEYVKVNEEAGTIFCSRCWCEISNG